MNRLQEIRKKAGMTQDSLAEKLHLKRSVISKYENGTIPLTDILIRELTQLFNVSADYLLGTSEYEDSSPYDPETLELMEEMHKRPENKVLFSLTKKAKPETVRAINALIKQMMKESGEDVDD